MALSNIGSNATEEFFETILYGTAYAEAQDALRGATGDIENELIQDAISGASNILVAGAMSVLIQKQEDLISSIFTMTSSYIGLLMGSAFVDKFKNRLKGFKGIKALKRLGFFNSGMSDRIALAQLGAGYNSHLMHSMNNKTNVTNNHGQVKAQKDYILKKENHNFQIGTEKAKSYQQTLLFKVLTKNFTANDKQIVKKILGNSESDMTDVDNLNQVADFMFVKDSNGDITGLSEQMFQMLNGLGYVHNK